MKETGELDNPINNRTKLLAAATHLFALHGYEAVGVQLIVAAVGVTKPTLYHYFGSKRGLLDALLAASFTDFFAAIERATVAVTFLGLLNTYASLVLNDCVSPDLEMTGQAIHQFVHGIFS